MFLMHLQAKFIAKRSFFVHFENKMNIFSTLFVTLQHGGLLSRRKHKLILFIFKIFKINFQFFVVRLEEVQDTFFLYLIYFAYSVAIVTNRIASHQLREITFVKMLYVVDVVVLVLYVCHPSKCCVFQFIFAVLVFSHFYCFHFQNFTFIWCVQRIRNI